MKGNSIVIVALTVLVLAIEKSEAVHCYSCSSSSGGCEDPFNPADMPTCIIYAKGIGSCVKARGANGIVRGCFTGTVTKDSCESNSNAFVCVCATDYCNEGRALRPTIGLLSSAIIITASAIHFAIKDQIL